MGAVMNGMAVSGAAARRRHVLRVQRLHARRGAPRRALAATRPRSCGPTTRSASARTGPPTSRSSTSRRCGRCPGCGSSVRPTPTRPRRRGGCTSTATARPRSCSPARSVPVLDGTAERAPDGRARGARTCSSTRGATRSTSCSSAPAPRCRCASPRATCWPRTASRCASCRCRRWDLFAAQTDEYRDAVLPAGVPTLAVEAGASFGWERYADDVVAIDHFGASAPGRDGAGRASASPPRTSRRVPARCSDRRRLRHDRARSPGSTTSGRAPGTTTSPARCCRRRARSSSSTTTASAASRRTRPSSTRRSTPARATTSSCVAVRRRRAVDRGHVLGGRASTTSRPPPTCSARCTTRSTAATASCRSRCRPTLAHDTDGTIAAGPVAVARGRPPERDDQDPGDARRASPRSRRRSPPGINVNVTLIFSLDRHDAVIEAYLNGLERLARDGRRPRRRSRRWRRSS